MVINGRKAILAENSMNKALDPSRINGFIDYLQEIQNNIYDHKTISWMIKHLIKLRAVREFLFVFDLHR